MVLLQALKELNSLLDVESEQAFVRGALTRRLADEDPRVLEAALQSSAALKALEPSDLVARVSELLARTRRALESRAVEKSERPKLRAVLCNVRRQYGHKTS